MTDGPGPNPVQIFAPGQPSEPTPGELVASVDFLVSQMQSASQSGLYMAAMFMALALPDICGALASETGTASGAKARRWLETECGYPPAYARLIYGFRCSLLHQGSALPDGGAYPLAFREPVPGYLVFHGFVTDVDGDRVQWLDMPMFVDEIAAKVREWLANHGTSARVQRNLKKFVRRRPDGLPPHMSGAPVVA